MTQFRLRLLIPALASLALAGPASAAEAKKFEPRTVADLADICSGGSIAAEKDAALNFCDGYAQGVLALVIDHEHDKLCLPDHPPTRRQTLAEFVTWSKAKESRGGVQAARGLEGFLKERFPCNK